MKFKASLILIIFSLINLQAQARDLTDVSLDIGTVKQGAEAKQDAFDQAIEQTTQKLTEELLGPEKSARYWPSLKAKLLKNSTRYVVFIKGSPPIEKAGQTQITVVMRLSPDNLETLLREEGVLNAGTLRVLPLFEVVDSHGARYAWWADMGEDDKTTSAQQDMFKRFFSHLGSKLKAKNVYVLDPTNPSFRMSVPAAYRTALLRKEDQMLLAQYLKADVVLSGRVDVARPRSENSELKLGYDMQLWQAKSGREIGAVQRAESLSSDTPKVVQALLEISSPKVVEEISAKIGDALASGNLNLNVVRVAVTGTMSYRQQAEFKRQLAQVREIRVLKERLFEPSRVVFEAETPMSGQDLAKVLQKARFPLYSLEVDSAQDDSLALSVRALSSSSAQ